MLLIETTDLGGKKVILTVTRDDSNASAELRLWEPKPGVGPFAGTLTASIRLSGRDAAELRRNL